MSRGMSKLAIHFVTRSYKNIFLTMCLLSGVMCKVSCVRCQVSCVTCPASHVMHHMSPVMCQVPDVTPTATSMDLPLLTPPIYTARWFAKTKQIFLSQNCKLTDTPVLSPPPGKIYRNYQHAVLLLSSLS